MSNNQCTTGVLAAAVLAASGAVFADTYYVPDNFDTIQEAIDGVSDGDEIGVRPGTYGESIDLHGKAIRLYSTDGPDVTTIDGTGLAATVVTCDEGEGPDTILEGLTITGGSGTYFEDVAITMGGGMVIVQSSPTVRRCTFDGNTAESGGGLAVYLAGRPLIEQCRFENNEATLATGWPDLGGGGGVLLHEAGATMTDCVLRSNQADGGGGMMARRSDTLITGTTFEENTAGAGSTGGLYSYDGETELRDCLFLANRATGHVGGYADNYGDVTVTGCEFIGNSSALSSGGALLWYTNQGTFSDCLFEGNWTETYPGGGLGLGYTIATVERCRFYDNTAQTSGGGVIMAYEGDLFVTSCEFTGNHASNGGGLATHASGRTVVTGSSFIDNSAIAGGGGISSECCDNLRVTGCLLAGNTAANGGAIHNSGGTPNIVATTIMDNSATNSGSGVYNCCTTSMTICGSVLWANIGDQIANWGGSTTTVTYTDVQGGHAGVGNLDVDPLCADPVNGDYRLLPASLCIDAGANNALPADEFDLDDDGDTRERLPLDLDGNYRFADLDTKADTGCGLPVIVDMGVYEFQGDPVHPILIGDVDGNGFVEFTDILGVLTEWGECNADCCLADVNSDWEVNFEDLLAILSNWS